MSFLILVRHGESRWNIANKFTGWVDVPLTEKGIYEAMIAAEELQGLDLDVAFTSKLVRAHQTLLAILAKQMKTGIFLHESDKRKGWSNHPDQFEDNEIPIFSDDALNERFYGDLQGKDKQKMREEFGDEQVHIWRRSWDVPPPNGESLKDTTARVLPYFTGQVMRAVKEGKNVIVSAHGNSLRAIIKHLDNISDQDIPHLELPFGEPIVYEWTGSDLKRDKEHSFNRPLHWQPTEGQHEDLQKQS